jgi:hypothetical protein
MRLDQFDVIRDLMGIEFSEGDGNIGGLVLTAWGIRDIQV